MKSLIIIIVNLFVFFNVISQNNNEQLEFIVENDKLVLDDKYYTSGLLLTYKKDLQKSFVFKKEEEDKLQLNITLGNQTYTPSNLQSIDVRDFDRPYAGWFFGKVEIGKIKRRSALFLAIETGITGEESLSGKLQTWLHETFNIDEPTWTQEIEYKFLVNLKAKYIWSRAISKFQAFNFIIEPSLGTKDIFIEKKIGYTFGRFHAFKQSSRNGFVDRTNANEFFGFIDFAYRYVAHNTLIQGSLDHKDALFTTSIESHIFKFKIGGILKFKQNTIKLIYNFNTKETPRSTSHSYGTISFSQNF